MNRDTLQSNFLNGMSMNEFLPLLVWGLIGLILSVAVDIVRNKSKIKRTGGFSLSYWFTDNTFRLLTSIIAVFIGAAFSNDLIGISGNKGALAAGFMTDKIIEMLVKFRENFDVSKLSSLIKKS